MKWNMWESLLFHNINMIWKIFNSQHFFPPMRNSEHYTSTAFLYKAIWFSFIPMLGLHKLDISEF